MDQDIFRLPPSRIAASIGGTVRPMAPASAGRWSHGDVEVTVHGAQGHASGPSIDLTAAESPVDVLHLRWQAAIPAGALILGDAWERGYGDLCWRSLVPERIMPWYALISAPRAPGGKEGLLGLGVATGAASLAFWRVDQEGVSLWLDVRSGGQGVLLAGRRLRVADVVAMDFQAASGPFQAAQALCRSLCPAPRLPDHAVYGSNNWYYAYGRSSQKEILADTDLLVEHAPTGSNRPYMVIDAGWQARATPADAPCGGPWTGNRDFPDPAALAQAMTARGARPGIWVRPLAASPDAPASWLLPVTRARDESARIRILDPSIPDVLDLIRQDLARIRGWGFTLIKHDWTACDMLGRWGFDWGQELTNPGWTFADRSRTTGEITRSLYQAIRDGAGDAVVIGCNTIGHLAAGIFELQRTGDDTSGRDWERTRRMGVNTLAFRMPQHGAFFAVDADCVGLTRQIPWPLNRQWLDLLSRSGTPLFVSAEHAAVGPEQKLALKEAFARAAMPRPVSEPLDWQGTSCPTHWRSQDGEARYAWSGAWGVEGPPR